MPTLAELANGPERVFPTHARIERYYPAAAAEEARRLLTRCLQRGEGPALLVGAPGTGKSMLLQVLAHELAATRTVACLTSAQLCTRRALLQSILFELGQPYRLRDEGDLRLALAEFLTHSEAGARGVVLLVDEAQTLPIRLLEELRLLGNLSHQGEPLVRLLLAGSQSLDETFTLPEIEAFNQRIVARSYLAPFNHHDTAQYIRGHLAALGGHPEELFTADGLDAVYHATDGIARLVSQLCDRALVLTAGHGALQVNKEIVQGAWADLQQLPTPWSLPDETPTLPANPQHHEPSFGEENQHEESPESEPHAVVEFGPLSDDGAEFALGSNFPSLAEESTADLPSETFAPPEPSTYSLSPFPEGEPQLSEAESLVSESKSLISKGEPLGENEPIDCEEFELSLEGDEGDLELELESGEESLKNSPEKEWGFGAAEPFASATEETEEYELAEPTECKSTSCSNSSCESGGCKTSQPAAIDPFGDDFEEEEVVIDEYAPLEASMPASRPQVTNSCETEISHLLHGVLLCESDILDQDEPANEALEAPVEQLPEAELVTATELPTEVLSQEEGSDYRGGFSVINPHDELTEHFPESQSAIEPQATTPEASESQPAPTEPALDLIVVDDDNVGDNASEAPLPGAHRSDYSQLFSDLQQS